MLNAFKTKASNTLIAAALGASLIFTLPATATEFSQFAQPAVATSGEADLIDANFKHKKFKRGFGGHRKFGHRSFSKHRKFGHRGFSNHRKFGHGSFGKRKVYKAKKFYLLKSAYPSVAPTQITDVTSVAA